MKEINREVPEVARSREGGRKTRSTGREGDEIDMCSEGRTEERSGGKKGGDN